MGGLNGASLNPRRGKSALEGAGLPRGAAVGARPRRVPLPGDGGELGGCEVPLCVAGNPPLEQWWPVARRWEAAFGHLRSLGSVLAPSAPKGAAERGEVCRRAAEIIIPRLAGGGKKRPKALFKGG